MTPDRSAIEHRVLILAPTGKDGALIAKMLARNEIEAEVSSTAPWFAQELYRGCGCIIVGEEALATGGLETLTTFVQRQPIWSDVPTLLLTHQGADSPATMQAVERLGNVALLERPLRVQTLVTAVPRALRARLQQYQT